MYIQRVTRETTDQDESRAGRLVHHASASGRAVKVVAYIEGIDHPRYEVESRIICRTSEQAAAVARVLSEARFDEPHARPLRPGTGS